MGEYKLYFINPTPRHIRDIVQFVADDDLSAIGMSEHRADGRAMELWEGERVVMVFDPQGPGQEIEMFKRNGCEGSPGGLASGSPSESRNA